MIVEDAILCEEQGSNSQGRREWPKNRPRMPYSESEQQDRNKRATKTHKALKQLDLSVNMRDFDLSGVLESDGFEWLSGGVCPVALLFIIHKFQPLLPNTPYNSIIKWKSSSPY